jgi:hypothetical protein
VLNHARIVRDDKPHTLTGAGAYLKWLTRANEFETYLAGLPEKREVKKVEAQKNDN